MAMRQYVTQEELQCIYKLERRHNTSKTTIKSKTIGSVQFSSPGLTRCREQAFQDHERVV